MGVIWGDFKFKHGHWALVTDASSGIGEEFAKQLAAKGLNVVLVARQSELLEKIGHEIKPPMVLRSK